MQKIDSKEYNWAFITADRVLSAVPCELVFAEVVPSATTITTALYDGVNTGGRLIIQFNITVVLNWQFNPSKPVYCEHGLYLDVGDDVTGVFVMWRELSHKEKGG